MERIIARRSHLQMMHATDGRHGIALVTERRPALVWLDLQLPEMTGEAVLRELWRDVAHE